MADPVKKVQTPAQREVVIGASAKALQAAGTAVQGLLNNLNETVDDLGLKIDNKTAELAGLEDQYKEKERQALVNMNLSLQEKGLTAANELLAKQGKTSVESAVLSALQEENKTLKANYKDDLTKATSAIQKEEAAKWNNEKLLLQAQNEKAAAEDKFALKGANEKIDLLQKQVDMLTKQLDEERKAGVQRAQAGAIGAINVGGDQNRR